MVVSAAVIGSAAIAGGTTYFAAEEQAGAADDAADLQARATRTAVEENRRQYEQTREDFEPWRKTGQVALGEYGRLYGVGEEGLLSEDEMNEARDRFQTTPGYQFAFDEGTRALDRSASATGRLRGGGFARELTRYGQGMANQEFGNYANRLASIASAGQEATGSTALAGARSAAGVSNAVMTGAVNQGQHIRDAGTARASGYVGIGNALTGGLKNLMSARGAG